MGSHMHENQIGDRPLTRRQVVRSGLLLSGALSAPGLLAACGGGEETSGSPTGTTATDSLKGTGTVVIGGFEDAALDAFKADMIPRFQKETGIKVRFLEDEYGTFFEKAFSDGQSQAGQYDVYIMDDPWIPQYAAAGILEDLGDQGVSLEGDFMPSFAELAYWPPRQGPRVKGFEDDDPQLVAMPFIGDLQTLVYRKDVFGESPATWDELVQEGREYANRGNEKYGYVFRGVSGNPIVASWHPIFGSFGGQFFDENWEPTFNNAEGKRAGEFLVNTLKSLAPAGIVEYDQDQEAAAVLGGQAAAAVMYSGNALKAADPKQSRVSNQLGYGIVPEEEVSQAQVGIFISGVSASAPNKENAVKFVRWWGQQQTQLALARAGTMPVRRSAFEDNRAQSANPLLQTALAQLDAGAEARPRTPDWGKVEELLGVELNRALQRGSLGDALDSAAEQVRSYFDRQGYYR